MKKLFFGLALMFAMFASLHAQPVATIHGPDPARVDWDNYYNVSVINTDLAKYDRFEWRVVAETFDYTSSHDEEEFWLNPEEEGFGRITVTLISYSGRPTISAVLNIDAEEWVYVPSVPDLDGATTVSVMDTESYLCTPSSGTDYEWDIPFGCTVVSGSDYQKSIKFYTGAGQTRLIKVRYKSNGVWSDWGSISVYVDYN